MSGVKRVANVIVLGNGEEFDLMRPDCRKIDIETLAASLSKLCRFNGHVRKFYSVAEHCVLVAALLPEELQLKGLLHDAAEAFVGDMVSPLKASQPEYKKIERRIDRAIRAQFDLPSGGHKEVKDADNIACATEARVLMPNSMYWEHQGLGMGKALVDIPWRLGWGPKRAEAEYLDAYERITR